MNLTPIKSIIADDETDCIFLLREKISRYCPEIHIVATATTHSSLIHEISENNPELLFLDIEMQEGNIFELLNKTDLSACEIIFVTAHEKYAIQAIRFSALDYLLKPIDAEDLKKAVSNAVEKIKSKVKNQQLEVLLHNLNVQNKDKKIALPSSKGMEFIRIKDIVYCKADNNYTTFFLADKSKIIVSKTIGEYEEILKEYQFIRIHQSHIINLNFLKSYTKGEGGSVVLVDNTELEVSRRKKEEFLQKVKEL
jgi:two-component system LytT family response regulator